MVAYQWPAQRPRGFRSLVRTAAWMLFMAIAGAWLCALAYPLETRYGLSELAAARLPYFGLAAGAILGLARCVEPAVRRSLFYLGTVLASGFSFWFLALESESVLVNLLHIPESRLDWLPWAAGIFGILLAGFALSTEVYSRFARHRRTKPHA